MNNDEAPEPSAGVSEIGPEDEEAGSNQNQGQASMAQTRRHKYECGYFQAQLCILVNCLSLHLVHPEYMSLKSMSAKELCEALPAHGFGVPDLYHDDFHDEGYDSARDLHTEYSTFKLRVFSVLKSQNRRSKL